MLNNVKRALITVLTLSFTVLGVLLAPIETKAYSSVALNSSHYRVEVSQTSNTSVSVSWAPSSTSNSRFIDMVHITGTVGSSQPVIYLALYGSDSVTFSITSGVSTNWTISIDNTYNVGSELYNESQINSSTSQILEEIQDLNTFLITMNSNELQTQAYVSNINTQIQNIISNGLKVQLLNYDVLLVQIPAIAYFVANDGIIQYTNDFINGKALLLDYPIYKGYTLNSSVNLFTDGDSDEYIFIVANNISYQIFANVTYTTLSGWSSVSTTGTGFKRYSDTLQVNYIKMKNNMDGSSYTRAQYYINFSNNAKNYLNNYQYIPIYYGKYSECPEEFLSLAGLKTNEVNELENNENDFNTSINSLNDIESDYNDELDSQLQNIDTDFDFENEFGSSFLSSGQWVVSQFNYIINNSPIGGVIKFSLIIGIALLIIGKKRGK